jgi:two-component system response regulator PhoP
MRALVIEDDSGFRSMVGECFKDDGFAIVAHDGETGLRMASELPVDITIIDLGLPGISGVETIRRMRAAGHQFPILILTARDDLQSKIEGVEAGADDYLTKPFRFDELLARARALVARFSGGENQPA